MAIPNQRKSAAAVKSQPSNESAKPKSKLVAAAHEVEYEFGGPIGSFGIVLSLPFTVLFLFYSAGGGGCMTLLPPSWSEFALRLPLDPWSLVSLDAVLVLIGWLLFQVLLERTLPGEKAKGVPLPDKNKTRLEYNINGHAAFWVSLLVLAAGFPQLEFGTDAATSTDWFDQFPRVTGVGPAPFVWLYDNYAQLAVASFIITLLMSVVLWAVSFRSGALLAKGGDTPSQIYNFYIGRELNPRIGDFDLKQWCELRPGLIGLLVLDLACAMKQYDLFGSVSWALVAIVAFQGLYVWDALFQEKAILTTMDITTDGFGCMLCFGDMAWVPFTYSLQARFLAELSPTDSPSGEFLFGVLALNMFGYWIFRSANSTKDAFRRDPSAPGVANIKYIETKSGRRLMTSGWWGWARKINYTGDWIMGLAWCMCTGTDCLVTYFYCIYFGILLAHRALRDDAACAEKYGDDWVRYKKEVPYLFFPRVF